MKIQETDTRTIKTYTIDDVGGFLLDIVTTENTFEAWLYHERYGIKESMFGLPKTQTPSLDEAISIIESNLPDYVADYIREYMTD